MNFSELVQHPDSYVLDYLSGDWNNQWDGSMKTMPMAYRSWQVIANRASRRYAKWGARDHSIWEHYFEYDRQDNDRSFLHQWTSLYRSIYWEEMIQRKFRKWGPSSSR